MSPRKRRKSQMFPEADNEGVISVVADEPLNSQDRTEKEREVWDAFREEHFEAIEQLPLSLHRQYTLIHELEQQSITHMADLLLTLKRYIAKRKSIMRETHSAAQLNIYDAVSQAREVTPTVISPLRVNGTTSNPGISPKPLSPASLQNCASLHMPLENRTSRTTRQMLSHVGYLTEELLRASGEKVNLAQAAYESVNRHACILEQAIQEQGAAISSGARPEYLAALNLPDLVPPRWAQMAPATPTTDDEIEIFSRNDLPEHLDTDKSSELLSDAKGRRQRFRGKRGKATFPGGHSDVQGTSLTITLPGHVTAGEPEETFCRCGGVSFGAMVGCDNDKCEGQWFHLGCVGLTELPTAGIWYCSLECRAIAETKSTAPTTRKRKRK